MKLEILSDAPNTRQEIKLGDMDATLLLRDGAYVLEFPFDETIKTLHIGRRGRWQDALCDALTYMYAKHKIIGKEA